MLEKLDLSLKLKKSDYKEKLDQMVVKIGALQRECKDLKIPVMIVFEGYGASGKGVQISELIQALDPRGFHVYSIRKATQEEIMRPFLWRFWTKTPEAGRIAIYDKSWYMKVSTDRFDGSTKKSDLPDYFQQINFFEKELTESGTCMIKFFLCISKKEQKKRFEKLKDNKETAWRVTDDDWKRNKEFDRYQKINEEMLQATDTDNAPWTAIEATDKQFATYKIYATVIRALEEQVRAVKEKQAEEAEKKSAEKKAAAKENDKFLSADEKKELETSILKTVDLSLTLTREDYKAKLKKLQEKLALLHSELYRRRIPVVIGFEGWDAGGKGGAIKRLTEKMDPRGYRVNPTAAPNDIEKAHHYLWRFWNNAPKAGHVAIFDRTWYGRVMVERIEGFCSKKEWQRAYKEINDMEQAFHKSGAIVMKFWMQIDKDEQERRFKERMGDPMKRWKITDEDWRNREKWDLYEEAVNEMLLRTSTTYAPWIIVEGNCKYYARVKVLETVVEAIENRLKEEK